MHNRSSFRRSDEDSAYIFVTHKARLRPHAKSKNGCMNCKLRRIKCQETRPACLNCVRRGCACEYPPSPPRALPSSDTLESEVEQIRHNELDHVSRSEFVACFSDWLNALPIRINSTKVVDTEMLCMFVNIYGKGWNLGRTGFLDRLTTMDTTNQLLQTAIKSLCLAHLSLEHGNNSLKQASRMLYAKTLELLRRNVSHVSRRVSNGPAPDLLATVMVVGLYDVEDLSDSHGQGDITSRWSHHFDGAQSLVNAYGPSAFDLTKPFQVEMLLTVWLLAWSLNLATRQPMHLGLQAWVDFGMGRFFQGTAFEGWHETVLPLPALISEIDRALANGASADEDGVLCGVSRLDELRRRMDTWLCSNMADARTIHVGNIYELDLTIEEHSFMSWANASIPTQFSFKDMQLGIFSIMSMIAALVCDCTVLRFVYAFPQLAWESNGIDSFAVREHAYRTSVNLCRSIHFLSQQQNTGYQDMELEVLSLCSRFFVEHGASAEVKWCEDCLLALRLRSKRLKKVSQQRLYQISEKRGALEDYGRFLATRVAS